MFISFCWFSSFPFVFLGSTRKWNARRKKKKGEDGKMSKGKHFLGGIFAWQLILIPKEPTNAESSFLFVFFLQFQNLIFLFCCVSPSSSSTKFKLYKCVVLSFNRHRTVIIIITWSRESMETDALKTRIFFYLECFSVCSDSISDPPFYFPLFSIRLCERG